MSETKLVHITDASPSGVEMQLADSIHAGFPVPASDEPLMRIDLARELVHHPESTFYARIAGDSMRDAGIYDGDIVVVDRSVSPRNGSIIVAYVDGEFTIKEYRIDENEQCAWLVPHNDAYKPICVTADNTFIIWGVVTFNVHKLS